MKKCNLIILLLIFSCNFLFAKNITFDNTKSTKSIGSYIEILEDNNDSYSINDVLNKPFQKTKTKVPNLGISESTYWIKIKITNNSITENLLLELSLPFLDYVKFFSPNENGFETIEMGEIFPFNYRKYQDPNYYFDINIPQNESKTFYLKLKSNEGIQLPIKIGTAKAFNNEIKSRDILSGLYFGIMLVMILYNLFVYFTVKDKSYIYYVIYIILILLTQTSLQGYPFQYLWPNTPIIAKYSLFIFPSLVGIASMVFMNVFLKVKSQNTFLFKISYFLSIPYIISILLSLLGNYKASFLTMEANAMIVSIYMLFTSIYIARKGYEPAKYFVAAWVVFLSGVVVYILKDFEILPFNNFTRYTMQIGSGIETILLSFALAARINTYKKERLEAVEEKERLVREQNIILEGQVKERTKELEQALKNLKEAQSQLVDAEKMSSLGQLTAGIAHEINNPINFVSSNISPLKQDIDDLEKIITKYEEIASADNLQEKLNEIDKLKEELDFNYLKTEIPSIIKGIEDGANRTKEIVSGLRNFSRLDEVEFQKANINEGINSTLILIKSKLVGINLIKKLGEIPMINCYPSKLNQLFMNLIDNAIAAIEEKGIDDGEIIIETGTINEFVFIKVTDNGIGIQQNIKPKIFDPFFTTKDVGKGTGLGLSISRTIVEAHNGSIEINTKENIGTEFTIKIPLEWKK